VLLLDVLHYWTPDKQELILRKARRALRPGGRLILRDAAQAETEEHRRVERWERFATRLGHNQTVEGLHFLTAAELLKTLRRAGFAQWEIKSGMGRDSNILLAASLENEI
jgi:SAM-dependent methyltransferase